MKISFICKKCGNDNQNELIDKEKSNKNWLVCINKCPKCGGKVELDLINLK